MEHFNTTCIYFAWRGREFEGGGGGGGGVMLKFRFDQYIKNILYMQRKMCKGIRKRNPHMIMKN